MKKKRLLIIVLIGICFSSVMACILLPSRTKQEESVSRCSSSVENLSETMLNGTWIAGNPDHLDTLIIKADGTYQQVIHIKFVNGQTINYTSNWQPWHLEYSEKKIPYLHLKNYAFCGMNPDISCEKRDGSGYDFCEDKYLPMNGEGILISLGTLDKIKTSHYLFYPLGSENTYIYSFQEP